MVYNADLGRHTTNGWHVVAIVEEVGRVLLQLELAEPLEDGICVLEHREKSTLWKGSTTGG